jgi:hypothetical protein
MNYLIGEQFSGEIGKLTCQLLGSVDAPNRKQAERLATERWPGREFCIYEMPKRKKPVDQEDAEADSTASA